jgi:hypothetical protein
MNARVLFAIAVLPFVAPALAAGQGAGRRVSVQGAVGTHIQDAGDNQSLSVGFSPIGRLDLLIGAERSHWPTEVTRGGATRGGTTTFISGEIRFVPLTFKRVSPYVLASAGRGISRPNVNDIFPDRVTNEAWLLLFGGGGVRVAVTGRLSAFADTRFGIQGELDTIRLLLPVRAGVAWRF